MYNDKRFKPNKKQYLALQYLLDDKHTEIFFGGSARVGKTYLAAAFAVMSCIHYDNIHIAICRYTIASMKKSTITAMYEFFRHQGIVEGEHFNFNRKDNILRFNNGSEIYFLDLSDNPSDPEFERLLSISLTHAIIDEGSQISKKAYDTLSSRLSHMIEEYNIIPKILIVSNPCKNFIYNRFYLPYKEDRLEPHMAVVLGLPTDNPTVGQSYIDRQLDTLSEPMKQRLIYGSWDYENEDYSVYKYDDIVNCFYNDADTTGQFYLSADIADVGKDRSVIIIWKGYEMVDMYIMKEAENIVEKRIKELIQKYNINVKNVVIDADGVGVGVANRITGCYKFKNGSRALNKENFKNLKTQVILKLAELVKNHQVKFLEKYKDEIIKEMQMIRYGQIEKDKIEIESKEKMKRRNDNKSPDIFDSIFMRFVFEIKKINKITVR